jgi:hypothetical protein
MSIADYFLIASAAVLTIVFGRIFINYSISSSFLAGLLVISSIISVSGRFFPLFTKELIIGFFILGLLHGLYELFLRYKLKLSSQISVDSKNWIIYSIFVILSWFYFSPLSYAEINYESHLALYFAPAFELLNAEYYGPLKSPILYPNLFANVHLLPAACVAVLGVFLDNFNLANFVEIKFLLIIFLFSSLIFFIYQRFNSGLIKIFLSTAFVLAIYGNEYSYNFYISSFLYVFILFELSKYFFASYNDSENLNSKNFLFFFIFLIICKAPIAYLALIIAAIIWLRTSEIRFKPIILVASILAFANILTWISFPELHSIETKNASKMSLGLNMRGVWGWSINDAVKLSLSFFLDYLIEFIALIKASIETMQIRKILESGIILIWMIIKSFLIGMFLIRSKSVSSILRYKKIITLMYLLSIFGFLFVKNGGVLGHQAHLTFLLSILTSIILIIFLISLKYTKIRATYLFAIFLFFSGFQSFYGLKLTTTQTYNPRDYKYLLYKDAEIQNNHSEYYSLSYDEPYWKSEINAMLSGLRINKKDLDCINYGQVRRFIVTEDSNSIICN